MVSEIQKKGQRAKAASYMLNIKTTCEKNEALTKIAEQLLMDQHDIIAENAKDLVNGEQQGMSASTLDRIMLNEERIVAMVDAIHLLVSLKDPVGTVIERIDKDNGLHIEKRMVPLGVIGMIYEARPNVTVDAATLSLKTGNAVILRGS